MAGSMIPDAHLISKADAVTVWVAAPAGPKDVWSLREAIAWAMGRPELDRIVLFRPPSPGVPAAWVQADQIKRIAAALQDRQAA